MALNIGPLQAEGLDVGPLQTSAVSGAIVGTIATSSTVSGTALGDAALVATAAGAATTTGTLVGRGRLNGSSITATTSSATLGGLGPISGTITTSSSLSGQMFVPNLAGTVQTRSLLSGLSTLSGLSLGPLSGTIISGQPAIGQPTRLRGKAAPGPSTISCGSTVTGTIHQVVSIVGTALAGAAPSGTLRGRYRAVGTAAARTTLSASLNGRTFGATANSTSLTRSTLLGVPRGRGRAVGTSTTRSTLTGTLNGEIETGWSTFPVGGTTFYVDAGSGLDSNPGTLALPKRTVAAGLALATSGVGDQVLLRRGGTYAPPGPVQISGASPTARFVLGAYGDVSLERPVISGSLAFSGPSNYVALVDLDVQGELDGMDWRGTDIRVEGCRAFRTSVEAGGIDSGFVATTIRYFRCVFSEPLGPGSYFTNVVDLVIDECVFDCGNEGGATIEHALQIDVPGTTLNTAVVRNTVVMRPGHRGIDLRAGGTIEDCLAVRCVEGFAVGVHPEPVRTIGTVRNSVVTKGRYSAVVGRGPTAFRVEQIGNGTTRFEGNIALDPIDTTQGAGLWIRTQAGGQAPHASSVLAITDNKFVGWPGGNGRALVSWENTNLPAVTISGNDGQTLTGALQRFIGDVGQTRANVTSFDNRFDPNINPNFTTSAETLSAWKAAVSDTTSSYTDVAYADESRTLEEYLASVQVTPASEAEFVDRLVTLRKGEYDSRFTASSINTWIRAGFGVEVSGWTDLTPSPDSLLVHCSAAGSDSTGNGSIGNPYRTMARGYTDLRNGFPDHLLLRRGDTFSGPALTWAKSGRNASEPMVCTAYGTSGARPIIYRNGAVGFTVNAGISHVYWAHLHLDPTDGVATFRPSGSRAFSVVGGLNVNLLFEGLYIQHFSMGFEVGPFSSPDTNRCTNIRIRRCGIDSMYSTVGATAQGILMRYTDSPVIEGNVIDRSGNEDADPAANPPTGFTHNMYVQTSNANVTVRGNFSSRPAAACMQVRGEGVVENNFSTLGASGLRIGGAGGSSDPWLLGPGAGYIASTVRNNVITDLNDNAANTARFGIQVHNSDGTVLEGNVIYNTAQIGSNQATGIRVEPHVGATATWGARNLILRENVVYDHGGRSILLVSQGAETSPGPWTIVDNDLQDVVETTQELISASSSVEAGAIAVSAGNEYEGTVAQSSWFRISTTDYDVAGWNAQVGDSTSVANVVSYPDTARTVGTYATSLGIGSTLDDFLTAAWANDIWTWNPALTAEALCDYVRAGFGLSSPSGRVIGTAAGVATSTGTMQAVGAMSGTALVVGPSVTSPARGIAGCVGTVTTSSSTTGTAFVKDAVDGTAAGAATVDGVMRALGVLSGTAQRGTAPPPSSVLIGHGAMLATASTSSLVAGGIRDFQSGTIQGTITTSTSVTGALTPFGLTGTATTSTSATGTIRTFRRASGVITGQTTLTGTIRNAIGGISGNLSGRSTGRASTLALMRARAALVGTAAGSSNPVGSLEFDDRLQGVSAGTALVLGNLSGRVRMRGTAGPKFIDVGGSIGARERIRTTVIQI